MTNTASSNQTSATKEVQKPIFTYRDLIVWQKAMDLVVHIYDLTQHFPKAEQYGLTSQMRRASVSIPSNIAEGRRRSTKNDYLHFLRISYGSGAELETQLEIAKRLSTTKKLDYQKVDVLLSEVMRMLCSILKKMNPKT